MFHHQQGQKSDKSNKALQKQHQTTHTTAPPVNGTHPATLIQRAKLNPNSLNTDDVLRLQQTIGNRAATQLIAGRSGQRVQAKLTIGEPGDKYEQEADRVAAEVVRQINAPAPSGQGEAVQRQMPEEKKEIAQRKYTSNSNVVQRYQQTDQGKLSQDGNLLLVNSQNLYAANDQFKQANSIPGQIEFEKGSTMTRDEKSLSLVKPKVKEDSDLKKKIDEFKELSSAEDLMTNLPENVKQNYNRREYDNLVDEFTKKYTGKTEKDVDELAEEMAETAIEEKVAKNLPNIKHRLKEYLNQQEKLREQPLLPSDCRALAAFIIEEGREEPGNVAPGAKYVYERDVNKEQAEWDYHYAAIIMTDGSDHVTLENAAAKVSDIYSKHEYDHSWYFEMYGTGEGQTFKEKYKADFKEGGEVKVIRPRAIVQREARPNEEDELMMKPMVQRQPDGGMAATADLEGSINQARGSGQPLANNIRKPMEQAFGANFSGVKVHTDSQSDQLNQSIQAKAFTTGQDVFFRQGAYQPGSRGGQELIAHELTHVVQQNGSTVQPQMANIAQRKGELGAATKRVQKRI